ncbi:MAG: cytochrome c peroxidase [Acidobacteriota bacterium]
MLIGTDPAESGEVVIEDPRTIVRSVPAIFSLLLVVTYAATAVGGPAPAPGAEAETARVENPGQAGEHTDFDRESLLRIQNPPLGLPKVPAPETNPPTIPKIRLGRKLFLDRRLSRNGTLSCAMCHVPEQGFTVNELQTSVGHAGQVLRRSAPTLLNVAYAGPFFHDGREPSLDLQPFDVFLNPDEMAAPSLGALVAKVRALPDYAPLFENAFRKHPTVENIGQAVGTYLRTLLSANSPFDRWHFGGDQEALSDAAKRGFERFTGKARCTQCHTIGDDHALFTDHRFHDTGLGWYSSLGMGKITEPIEVEIAPGMVAHLEQSSLASVSDPPANDLGRYEVTDDPADRWLFKTPTLRNVSLTAPYMHDGSFSTLRGVVEFYNRGAHRHEALDPVLHPLDLTEGEIDELVAFLESLTGDNIDELVRDARSQAIGNPVGTGSPGR